MASSSADSTPLVASTSPTAPLSVAPAGNVDSLTGSPEQPPPAAADGESVSGTTVVTTSSTRIDATTVVLFSTTSTTLPAATSAATSAAAEQGSSTTEVSVPGIRGRGVCKAAGSVPTGSNVFLSVAGAA